MTAKLTKQQGDGARAHGALLAAGGILGRADAAKRWGVSGSRVRQLSATEGFPPPRGEVNGQPYWLAADLDAWRAAQPPTGRPRTSDSQS